MKKYISIECDPNKPEACSQQLAHELQKGLWVSLSSENEKHQVIKARDLPIGPGVIMRGGGSTGKLQQCLHESSHFDQSSLATAQWIKQQGIEPESCYILNPLPLHHVSGLLPWWRSRCWGAKHKWITPKAMHDPNQLEEDLNALLQKGIGPIITSLVPTQLHRLLQHPSGVRWLQLCTIIYIGGSSLSTELANASRELQLPLAPCYGTTETAAMVTAQTPKAFLSGNNLLGAPLNDVELRLGKTNSLQIRTQRLAKVFSADGNLKSIQDSCGWWESGDAAALILDNQIQQLKVIGRRDTAINTGGEIIFPETLQVKLVRAAQKNQIPIKAILLIPIRNAEWGSRLVALVRLKSKASTLEHQTVLIRLQQIVQSWPPFERPITWHNCPKLAKNELGKWEINKWQAWVEKH